MKGQNRKNKAEKIDEYLNDEKLFNLIKQTKNNRFTLLNADLENDDVEKIKFLIRKKKLRINESKINVSVNVVSSSLI